jgi:hypothetical protein
MKKADKFNPGKWLVENKLTNQSQLNEVVINNPVLKVDVRQILTNIGEDLDQMLAAEPTIERGTEEWMAILEEITGKDPYNNNTEYTERESALIQKFIEEAEELGLEII